VMIVMAVALIALLGAATVLFIDLRQARTDYATLQADEQATRDRYDTAIYEIAAIQDSLNAIVLGEEGMQALASDLETETSLSRARGDEAMARIGLIKDGIERARDRIQELELKVAEGQVEIAGLGRVIANLRHTLAEKEVMVAQLTHRVDELQTQVTGLVAEVAEGQQVIQFQEAVIQTQMTQIENTRRTLGTIYYTVRSKDELKDSGTVISTGGFLGIGRTLTPSGRIDPTLFTPLDTDLESVIDIPSTRARVLSSQPVSSYQLLPVEDHTELRILNPDAFRTVQHVIIMAD
jgi:uncharacterized coiled-coil protein SlyX